MPVAIELRTTCERCRDPLPVNGWGTAITCWACLHENPLSPEHWAQILRGALEDYWTLDEGEGRTENLKVGKRSFELRFSVPKRVKGASRKRPKDMRQDLFPGVVGLVGEETEKPKSTENVAYTCPQCAGALSIDGRSREVTCSYCHAKTLLSDDAWRRIHPVHAQRAWILVLEDDEEAANIGKGGGKEAQVRPEKAEREAPMGPNFSLQDLVVGPDGLIYAVVEFDKAALVCLDADLGMRWRTDVKQSMPGFTRIAVVGDEVWWADATKHFVRRFSRADGKDLGKIGGPEPVNAKVHHLDVKGAGDLVGCPDGTALMFVAHRLVRYDKAGKGIPTWKGSGGLLGMFFGERVWSLYEGDDEDDPDDDGPVSFRTIRDENRQAAADHLGQNKPTRTLTLQTRGVVGKDGSLWFSNGEKVFRYAADGTCKWTAVLEGSVAPTNVRPGIDGDLNVYATGVDKRDKAVLYRVSPTGKVAKIAEGGLGYPLGLAVTGDGRITVFGPDKNEVRILDRDGKRLKASAAAVDADRYADAEEAENDDDEEEEE